MLNIAPETTLTRSFTYQITIKDPERGEEDHIEVAFADDQHVMTAVRRALSEYPVPLLYAKVMRGCRFVGTAHSVPGDCSMPPWPVCSGRMTKAKLEGIWRKEGRKLTQPKPTYAQKEIAQLRAENDALRAELSAARETIARLDLDPDLDHRTDPRTIVRTAKSVTQENETDASHLTLEDE